MNISLAKIVSGIELGYVINIAVYLTMAVFIAIVLTGVLVDNQNKNNTFIKSIAHDIVLGTRDDWDNAVFIRTIGQPFYVQLLVELLSCKVCLSFHLSFWISLIIVVCTPIAWPFIPVATLSWPYLVNVLLTKLK